MRHALLLTFGGFGCGCLLDSGGILACGSCEHFFGLIIDIHRIVFVDGVVDRSGGSSRRVDVFCMAWVALRVQLLLGFRATWLPARLRHAESFRIILKRTSEQKGNKHLADNLQNCLCALLKRSVSRHLHVRLSLLGVLELRAFGSSGIGQQASETLSTLVCVGGA